MDFLAQNNDVMLNKNQFKESLLERDQVCLFCWHSRILHGAHIIAHQQNSLIPAHVKKIMAAAGIRDKNQVQNGLLLCIGCLISFDRLQIYLDVVEEKLVVKVVNYTNDPTNEKHLLWKAHVKSLKIARQGQEEYFHDGRKAVEPNGEMALYFHQNNEEIQPNRIALERRKTACLIWKMAGGA